MIVKGVRRSGEYYDSVTLMLVARKLTEADGVDDASVVMGTPSNLDILRAGGLFPETFADATGNDLLIVARAAREEAVDAALAQAEVLLQESKHRKSEGGDHLPRSLEGALQKLPGANMVIISVAGRYAARLTEEALERGRHVMLFSDNVSVADEKRLKALAQEKGLLLMGPDCGTAIINGAPLGFANVVPRGKIGIVAASGTGLQEVSATIANLGGGISQALGTGGRDVKAEIGGVMFLAGLEALARDAATEVIVLVSKPPALAVQQAVAARVRGIAKPVVAILIGGDPEVLRAAGAHTAEGLEEAGYVAVALARGEDPKAATAQLSARREALRGQAEELAARMSAGQRYLRGLYSGGTLCDETQLIFQQELGAVYSPAPIDPAFKLEDIWASKENTVVDLGEDEFTVGRPHPMIDFSLRTKRLVQEAADPEVAVILLDVVLGYGSNMQPGEELAPAIRRAHEVAQAAGRTLAILAAITGTEGDPQQRDKVKAELEGAGAMVLPSNAAAATLSMYIVKCLAGR